MHDHQVHRRLAFEATHLTSTATVRHAMRDPSRGVGHSLSGLRAAGIVRRHEAVETALASVTEWMLLNYRNESVYKNAIANRILLERHGLEKAALVNELRVADSIADCVVINGHASVYEIKTELDNPAKLYKQLDDYRKVFRSLTVVTHASLAGKYLDMLEGLPTGVVTLDESGRLRTRRKSSLTTDGLKIDSMVKTLRKPEYTRIAQRILGGPIDAPPTKHFAKCLEIARTVSPLDYCLLLEDELRRRKPRAGADIADAQFEHLRHQLLKVDPSSSQLANVAEWMTGRL